VDDHLPSVGIGWGAQDDQGGTSVPTAEDSIVARPIRYHRIPTRAGGF
jgi:hypothetical protein